MARTRNWLRRLAEPVLARGRAFGGDQEAAVAIEFAILALPFFSIIFAILETAVVFLAMQVLDSATEDASRLIRTGQAKTSGFVLSDFRQAVCNSLFDMFDCSQLQIKVNVLPNFTSATPTQPQTCGPDPAPPHTVKCQWAFTSAYDGGGFRSVMQVQVFYLWPLLVDLPYFNLSNQPDNHRLISAMRVFRNEPFS